MGKEASLAPAKRSFCTHSSNHPMVCPTGFDTSRQIVMPRGGAQIAMSKQVACNADLTGHCNSPGCGSRISCVMRSDAEADADREPIEAFIESHLRESAVAYGTHPECRAGRTAEYPWTNDIQIKGEIRDQQFGDQ